MSSASTTAAATQALDGSLPRAMRFARSTKYASVGTRTVRATGGEAQDHVTTTCASSTTDASWLDHRRCPWSWDRLSVCVYRVARSGLSPLWNRRGSLPSYRSRSRSFLLLPDHAVLTTVTCDAVAINPTKARAPGTPPCVNASTSQAAILSTDPSITTIISCRVVMRLPELKGFTETAHLF